MNTSLMPDPLAGGIADYGRRLRAGQTSAERCVSDYLARIRALDGALGAYRHLDAEGALRSARDINDRLAAGTDLGPLMGVPVALKDIIVVDGMPTTAGSQLDVSGMLAREGGFVARLRAAGCILLGKLSTCEFAIGSAGVNYLAGTPRNPWDAQTFRVPGGSSSGTAVAMAAGLCGFSIGTDTGGSVRTPASFCGVFGMKPSPGVWPLDGVLPMSRSLDGIGFMARSAADAAMILDVLAGAPSAPVPLAGLRLARPRGFFDGISPVVADTLDTAFAAMEDAGGRFVDIDAHELDECAALYLTVSGPELMAELGPERFAAWRPRMNPDVASRIDRGARISPVDHRRGLERLRQLRAHGASLFRSFDALIGPTKHNVAPVFPGSYEQSNDETMASQCAGPTRAANIMGLCAASLPLRPVGATLPVGLQLICAGGADATLLAIARTLETVLGPPARPRLEAFLRT